MAFGFSGFQVGKELGAAMARPVDFSATTNYLLNQAARQKQIHQQMLQVVSKDLSNVDFNGVMRPDMPLLMEKYEKWRNLAVEHPEAATNPRSRYYKDISNAKAEFNATKNMLVEGAKQVSEASQFMLRNSMKDRFLTEEGLKKWKLINEKGYAAYVKQNPDEPNIAQAIAPDFKDSIDQINTAINKAVDLGAMKTATASDNQKGISTKWSVAPNSYLGVLSLAGKNFDTMRPGAKEQFTHEFNLMGQSEKDKFAEEVRAAYDNAPESILGSKAKQEIDNFKVDNPEDLFKGYILKKYAPSQVGEPEESGLHKMERQEAHQAFGESMQMKNFGLSLQRTNMTLSKMDEATWKQVQDEATSMAEKWRTRENARLKAAQQPLVTSGQYNSYRSNVLESIINSRMRSGVAVPSEYHGDMGRVSRPAVPPNSKEKNYFNP